jgi:hypothetical protein
MRRRCIMSMPLSIIAKPLGTMRKKTMRMQRIKRSSRMAIRSRPFATAMRQPSTMSSTTANPARTSRDAGQPCSSWISPK